jgi:glycosyltransferase involved in cell wall biosynthesis
MANPTLVQPPRVLLVTGALVSRAFGGRELLSKLNCEALSQVCNGSLSLLELPKHPLHGMQALRGVGKGFIDGLDPQVIHGIVSTIQDQGIACVFLDGSNLGAVAKAVRATCPGVRVITFFHNCEARFFLGAARQKPSVRALGVLAANYLAERLSVRYSHTRICLSERDSKQIQRLYGRGATHLSAMAMKDQVAGSAQQPSILSGKQYALFVGGGFYANQSGIAWFARNVAPQISLKTCVVGKGLGEVRRALEEHGNMEVIGEVDDVAPWYEGAHFVVAPIFDGSGMKTKVAEALMFGKRIIGTPEAFSGYEAHIAAVGVVCRSAKEFVGAIACELKRDPTPPSSTLRAIYEEHYSFEAAVNRLAAILTEQGVLVEAKGP